MVPGHQAVVVVKALPVKVPVEKAQRVPLEKVPAEKAPPRGLRLLGSLAKSPLVNRVVLLTWADCPVGLMAVAVREEYVPVVGVPLKSEGRGTTGEVKANDENTSAARIDVFILLASFFLVSDVSRLEGLC